jgi:hypothetical protein
MPSIQRADVSSLGITIQLPLLLQLLLPLLP